MSVSPGSPNPGDIDDLKDPKFVAWLICELQGDALEPDDEDFEEPHVLTPDKEADELYRLAITRKLVRMYAKWKASQN
jgi:hypothetical protein